MKNTYTKPELKIVSFTAVDVICSSVFDNEPETLLTVINSKEAVSYGSSSASMFEL